MNLDMISSSLPNYTGPYISDGKIQKSVEFGAKMPKDRLDAASRLHDSAYARFSDRNHRLAADELFNIEAKRIGVPFANVARHAVVYGNHLQNVVGNLTAAASAGPAGFFLGTAKSGSDIYEYEKDRDRYMGDVLDYYSTDPLGASHQQLNRLGEHFQNVKNLHSTTRKSGYSRVNTQWKLNEKGKYVKTK